MQLLCVCVCVRVCLCNCFSCSSRWTPALCVPPQVKAATAAGRLMVSPSRLPLSHDAPPLKPNPFTHVSNCHFFLFCLFTLQSSVCYLYFFPPQMAAAETGRWFPVWTVCPTSWSGSAASTRAWVATVWFLRDPPPLRVFPQPHHPTDGHRLTLMSPVNKKWAHSTHPRPAFLLISEDVLIKIFIFFMHIVPFVL